MTPHNARLEIGREICRLHIDPSVATLNVVPSEDGALAAIVTMQIWGLFVEGPATEILRVFQSSQTWLDLVDELAFAGLLIHR
ncbi:hypothetical protein FYK55_03495 [Roseiconus nitratireducens]|uniref:Uncharacterized protein n=1 Tax=Roseiconus nitratireducens TaxID=2605748 RepID=A0A5M6DII2_9BACT|nr:hypothetical protein [Roseiconus nitratireducens]KAA5545989.1 hypothetical protein FYK55_03495 [Roseiconus nitratireducens]